MSGRFRHGNSIAEYVLPAAMFFVMVGIAVMVVDLPRVLANLFSETTNGHLNGNLVQVQALGSIATPPGARNLPPVEPGQEQVCITYQLCVNVPILDGRSSIETAGAMGGDETRQLSLVLNQIATRLRELGADDNLIDMVTRLANSGHQLSDSVQDLEQLCPNRRCGQNRDAFNTRWQDVMNTRQAYNSMKQEYDAYIAANPGVFAVLPEARDLIDKEAQSIIDLANTFNFNERTRTREQEIGEVVPQYYDEYGYYGYYGYPYYGYGYNPYYGYGYGYPYNNGRQLMVRRQNYWGGYYDDNPQYDYVEMSGNTEIRQDCDYEGYCRQVAVETTTELQDIVIEADSEPIRQSSNDICATGGRHNQCLRSQDGRTWTPTGG